MNDLDRLFLLPGKVMDFTSARARALGANLAHASQPGYRRNDVDFAVLAKAARDEHGHKEGALAKVHPTAELDTKTPVGADGSNVDYEREQIEIEKNALLHELAAFMVQGRVSTLKSAIRGQA